MGRLTEKVAIITGGAGGIGIAAAKKFIAEGCQVMLVDLDEAALKQAQTDIGSNQLSYCVADVSDSTSVKSFVDTAVERYGGFDILLANAGIEGQFAPITDYDEAVFDKVMAVNVRGVWLGLKHAFPVMQKRGGGSIVITSSVAGLRGSPGLSAYVTSKHAVIGMMRSAALEGSKNNIRVNTVNPSPVETRMMRSIEEGIMPGQAEAIHDQMAQGIPVGRYAEPEDIANIMLFLASDEASFLTGGVYSADGGMTAK
ncbi:MAG: glucose 1-dehydrogenase [Pseudomonadales bacterium]|nr:glucose 1-dehydrogenase [Pseudomonadales bacterium]